MASDNIIDISTAINGNRAQRKAVAKEIGSALERIGGMMITGHGISHQLINDTRSIYREFYDLPKDYKKQFTRPETEAVARGYTCRVDVEGSNPGMERFSLGDFETPANDYYKSSLGNQYFPPNILPEQPPEFASIAKAYFSEIRQLSLRMFTLFELALNTPKGYFTDNLQASSGNLTAILYPGLKSAPKGQFRIQEHTDSGALTILNTQATIDPALQFMNKAGEWENIQPSENNFVINIGDLLHRWSNGRWISTAHRVLNPKKGNAHIPRISVVYFEHPDYSATIASYTAPGEKSKFADVNSGEFEYIKRLKIHLMSDKELTAMLNRQVVKR